jgi:hypothetical protein
MTKKEILAQMKKSQKLQNEQNSQETKILNPNYKKGRRSYRDIFNGVDRRKYITVDF